MWALSLAACSPPGGVGRAAAPPVSEVIQLAPAPTDTSTWPTVTAQGEGPGSTVTSPRPLVPALGSGHTPAPPLAVATPSPDRPVTATLGVTPTTMADTSVAPPTTPPELTKVLLPGVHHEYQRWNNCGPTTVLMALSAFGVRLDQAEVQARLKPDREDTNVSPDELARFAEERGFRSIVRAGGDRHIARALLRAGVPVMAEQWIDVQGRGEMGHYRVLIGYDDELGEFISHDSYYGANRRFAYDDFDRMWLPFLGAYVIAYRPVQEAAVRQALGGDWDEAAMWARARAEREAATAAGAQDLWSWFSLGTARSRTGDHGGAVAAFDRAIAMGLPFRTFWYQFDLYRSLFALGDYPRIIDRADQTLAAMKGENLEEQRYWKGRALGALGREEEALTEFHTALRFNPLFTAASEALAGR